MLGLLMCNGVVKGDYEFNIKIFNISQIEDEKMLSIVILNNNDTIRYFEFFLEKNLNVANFIFNYIKNELKNNKCVDYITSTKKFLKFISIKNINF